MAPTTFHYFPELPKSIRETIWAAAIRSNQPGAQVFGVYDTSIEAERNLLSEYALGLPRLGNYALGAPFVKDLDDSDDSDSSAGSNDQDDQDDLGILDDQDDSNDSGNCSDGSDGSDGSDSSDISYTNVLTSWVKHNESTYMIDAGLWAACSESRAIIKRWFEKTKNQDVNDKSDIPDVQAATWFIVDGESLPCLTSPRTDLFYLVFPNAKTIDWTRISGLPLSRHSQYRVSHVALTLKSDIWGKWEGKKGQSIVKAASGELWWARNLWFINYDITRRRGAPVRNRNHRHRFYGNGYVFTEVRQCDTDWYVWDGGLSVSDFLTRLEIEVAKYCTKRDKVLVRYRAGSYEYRYIGDRPDIGVLALEKCAS